MRDIISELIHLLPRAWERYFAKRFPSRHQLTLLHADACLVNFMVPRTQGDGSIYMLDWQGQWAGMGAFDLVMMCASFWTSAQLQENKREETMLRRYLAALQAHGVTYTWDQLLESPTGRRFAGGRTARSGVFRSLQAQSFCVSPKLGPSPLPGSASASE